MCIHLFLLRRLLECSRMIKMSYYTRLHVLYCLHLHFSCPRVLMKSLRLELMMTIFQDLIQLFSYFLFEHCFSLPFYCLPL